MEAKLYNQAGDEVGTLELNEYIFGITPNQPVMHQAMVRQLANARLGTHNTRGRGEVKGSTAKLFRQKGTGRSRQGSIRAPHRKGGGVAHGPHPRSYEQRMPRKMRRLAVRSALSVKYAAEQIRFIEDLTLNQPRTKDVIAFLQTHGIEGKALIIMDRKDEILQRSANNLPYVMTQLAHYLNVIDLLRFDTIVMPKAAVAVLDSFLGQRSRFATTVAAGDSAAETDSIAGSDSTTVTGEEV